MTYSRRFVVFAGALAFAGSAAAQSLPSVTVQEAQARLAAGQSVLIDIRTPEEWAETGVPRGAVRLDMTANDFVPRLDQLRKANPGKSLDLICRTANRSSFAQGRLAAMGFKEVVNVRGGVAGRAPDAGWVAAGLPVEK